MMQDELQGQIAAQLAQAGFEFKAEPAVGGLRPDFVVQSPGGESFVIEVKDWLPSSENTVRASRQADLYTEATGANGAVLVIPDLLSEYSSGNVVNVEGLVPRLQELASVPSVEGSHLTLQSTDKNIFAAMPFADKYDDTYFVGMIRAALENEAVCDRVDHQNYHGDVVIKIKELIEKSQAVIVDLSESRPNVLFEAGYAHALGRPLTYICSTSMDHVPFDVRNEPIIKYGIGQTTKLARALGKRLRGILSS
jgi:hypothetical protein